MKFEGLLKTVQFTQIFQMSREIVWFIQKLKNNKAQTAVVQAPKAEIQYNQLSIT